MCLPWSPPRIAAALHNDPIQSSNMQKSFTMLECFAAAEQCDKKALRRTALTSALIDGACVAALVPWTCPVWEGFSAGDVVSETANTVVALCVQSTSETSWSVAKTLSSRKSSRCAVFCKGCLAPQCRRAFCTDMISRKWGGIM